jgi:DNA-binding transcriptional LysR family regulator
MLVCHGELTRASATIRSSHDGRPVLSVERRLKQGSIALEIRDLEYFDVIARTQNLGTAAQIVGRTKPALTKCIRRLEEAIGAALFVRSGRGIVLTAAGMTLRDRAERLRSQATEVRREVRDVATGAAGHVRIGMGARPAQDILPNIIGDLIAAMPDVTIEIIIGINNELRNALRSGELDLVVGPSALERVEEFQSHVLLNDEVVIAAGKGHPLLSRRVGLKDLAGQRWVLPHQSAEQRIWLEEVFRKQGLPPPQAQIETNSLYLLPDLIAHTRLLTFMPRRHLSRKPSGVGLFEIKLAATTMRRRFEVMYRQHAYLPPAALRVVALLREDARKRALKRG